MKLKTTKSSIYIGVNWLLVALCLIIAIFAWYHTSHNTKPAMLFFPGYPVLGICAIAAAIYSTQAFKINEQGIWVYYLGISFRHIYWNEVRGVVLAPYQNGKKKDSILILLNQAPPFTGKVSAAQYAKKNTALCYCITFPENRIKEISAIINSIIWEHIEPIAIDADE